MYDYINLKLPETFDGMWMYIWEKHLIVDNNKYDLRDDYDIFISHKRYVYLDTHPFQYKCWNELSIDIRFIGYRSFFAKKVKSILHNRAQLVNIDHFELFLNTHDLLNLQNQVKLVVFSSSNHN